jgi:hypothetical protein
MVASAFSWGDFPVVGISFDICGAVILAWSFSAKTPWRIREEIPRSVVSPTTLGTITVPFPQGLARSMARQRAEARLGVVLLVLGFLCQAVYYFFPHTAMLETGTERLIALLLALFPVALAIVGMRVYVPRSEHRTFAEVETGERRVWKHARRLARRGVTPEQMRGDRSN